MNFKKAFNSVSHSRLLTKLKSFGINGKLWLWLRWLEVYLSDHYQCVQWATQFLSFVMYTIKCATREPSIPGPLLFAIYINDLPDLLTPLYYIY